MKVTEAATRTKQNTTRQTRGENSLPSLPAVRILVEATMSSKRATREVLPAMFSSGKQRVQAERRRNKRRTHSLRARQKFKLCTVSNINSLVAHAREMEVRFNRNAALWRKKCCQWREG